MRIWGAQKVKGYRRRVGAGRGALRLGARRPSGRPGTRWLRVDRKPLSTERPGPTRVAPSPRLSRSREGPPSGRNAPLSRAAGAGPGSQWRCAQVAHRPMAQLRSTTARRSPGRTSCGGLGRTYRPSTACCQQVLRLRRFRVAPGQPRAHPSAARSGKRSPCRHLPTRCHSFGGPKTVRPPTTVRRHTGRSLPGVRSGRPGVPERGSVDQRSTRSSGAWTIRSPVRQTA